jgi:ribosomal protein L31
MNKPNLHPEYDIVVQQLNGDNYVIIKSPEKVEYDIKIEQHFLNHLVNLWNLQNLKVKILTTN